jgi:hypothetical protein
MADFGSIDANGDGQLSYDEVKAAATKVARAPTPGTHWVLLCARSQLLAHGLADPLTTASSRLR